MVHLGQHVRRLLDQPVAALAMNMGDETDAAGVVFVCRIVETCLAGAELHAASPRWTLRSASAVSGPAFSTRKAAKSRAAARSLRRA